MNYKTSQDKLQKSIDYFITLKNETKFNKQNNKPYFETMKNNEEDFSVHYNDYKIYINTYVKKTKKSKKNKSIINEHKIKEETQIKLSEFGQEDIFKCNITQEEKDKKEEEQYEQIDENELDVDEWINIDM
jgi:hypothetical protein